MVKIIVFGPNGMLGRYITEYFTKRNLEVVKINRKIYDAADNDSSKLLRILKSHVDEAHMDDIYVINCIGIIPQKNSIENETSLFIKVNSIFPHLLSICSRILNFKLIHITTDCVFDGLVGSYDENSIHTEKNIYGKSKSSGEPSDCCVIRTSIIGEELQGKKSLLEWVRSQNNREIGGFINHHWNGVTCLQLAKIIDQMIREHNLWEGVRHIHSPDSVSKYQLVKDIIEVYQLDIKLFVDSKYSTDKTLKSIYDNNFQIPPIRKQIEELINFDLGEI